MMVGRLLSFSEGQFSGGYVKLRRGIKDGLMNIKFYLPDGGLGGVHQERATSRFDGC